MNFANLITLTTDFGLQDPYVGQMKGAILKRNVTARIIDLTHGIPPHDVLTAALTLRTSYSYFPDGTIHLVVVDPGVGSQRSILAATGDGHLFIAPDNGILSLLAADNRLKHVHRVENRTLFPSEVSCTFHGRDIMAPVAAALAAGMPLNRVGPEVSFADCERLDLPRPRISAQGIEGQVLHIDRFGNVRTTITTALLSRFQPGSFACIEIGGERINTIATTYSQCPPGDLIAVIDSSGYLEIAVNKGSAAEVTGCGPGDPVIVRMKNQAMAE
ncbi:S-adenosyl-l-methionine hydroxide adenosyltransferase family protein [Thermodesulfobacteriota bacterium B35]